MFSAKKAAIPALCLSLCLSAGMVAPAHAAQLPPTPGYQEITPYALYIRNSNCNLIINGKTATVSSMVSGQPGVVDRCKVVVSLQEKVGSTWRTVATWTDDQDALRASVSETETVTSGRTYRAKAVVTVWSGSQSESKTIITIEKTA